MIFPIPDLPPLRPLRKKDIKARQIANKQSILDTAVPNKVVGKLPRALKPKPCTPKPKPKHRLPLFHRLLVTAKTPKTQKIPKEIDIKVKKLIDEIAPYYKAEAIDTFKTLLSTPRVPKTDITEMRRALKNNIKTFDVKIMDRKDPAKQLSETTLDVAREFENLFNKRRGFKFVVTMKITFKKETSENGEEYFIY